MNFFERTLSPKHHIKRNIWDSEALLCDTSENLPALGCWQDAGSARAPHSQHWFAAGKAWLPCLLPQMSVQRRPSCCSQWCKCLLPWAMLLISWGLARAKCTWKLCAGLGPKHANGNWAVPCTQFIISGCQGRCVLGCYWTICCTTLWGFSSLLGCLIKFIWGSKNISKTAWSNLSTFLCSCSFWPWASRVNGNWQEWVCPTTGSSWH